MKPYYETKNGKLYCGDSLEVMNQIKIELGGVNLIITDPPYGINAEKGIGLDGLAKSKKYTDNWDSFTPSKEYFEVMQILSSKMIIFGGNYFTDKLPQSNKWLVWDKVGDMIQFDTLSDCELIYTNIKGNNVKKIKFIQKGFIAYEKERFHPTQKPVGLYVELLRQFSDDDDIILDCFSGSGTLAVACERLNKKWICIEKEKKYCDITIKRLNDGVQKSLF